MLTAKDSSKETERMPHLAMNNDLAFSALTRTQINSESQASVWVWGNDGSGQLGIRSKPDSKAFLKSPKEFIWRVRIKQIACGREHAALVSQEGQLYMIGSNLNGKLGLG